MPSVWQLVKYIYLKMCNATVRRINSQVNCTDANMTFLYGKIGQSAFGIAMNYIPFELA